MNEATDKYWFVFWNDRLVMNRDPVGILSGSLPPLRGRVGTPPHEIGELDGRRCLAYETDAEPDEALFRVVPLREAFDLIDRPFYEKAGHGSELIFWDKTTTFCSCCGARTEKAGPIVKRCTGCGREIFPQVAPAIIVLIHRDESVLLVQAHNFKGTFYGLVAGFVEPGETLEQCVQREVREETGLEVSNIRYFASQPWPYPCGEMIGFNADYVSGELCLQQEELKAAEFFDRHHLPELPRKLSLARALIDNWLGEQNSRSVATR